MHRLAPYGKQDAVLPVPLALAKHTYFLTEDGPRPEFVTLYGAQDMPTAAYPPRTIRIVRASHASLWFGETDTPGDLTTIRDGVSHMQAYLLVIPGRMVRYSHLATWISEHPIREFFEQLGFRSA
jgi:hypothetical protein